MAPEIASSKEAAGFSKKKHGQRQQREVAAKGAYVTFLAGKGDYVKGAVGLAKGLRRAGSAYPLVVAVLPDVPESHRRLLVSQGCVVREIEPVYPPENQTRFAMAYYVINYSKLRIWQFVEYEKMVYLDADIQVFDNIDHLFDLPDGHFYAVMDCFCERTWSHTPQYKVGYCQQRPEGAPWPESELGPPPPAYFNAGMFVHEPSMGTCKRLLATLRVTPPTPFAEQDFLNLFFRDAYRPIPLAYNLVMAMLWHHPEKVKLADVKVVHYCAAATTSEPPWTHHGDDTVMGIYLGKRYLTPFQGSKPWKYTGEEENMDKEDIRALVERWWDIYDDESLDYKGASLATVAVGQAAAEEEAGADGRKQPFRTTLSKAGEVRFVTAPSAA
ncbi:hypothetical protein Taro_009934 [Colocasia esculenta]|uniref:Hexosyltransferase n=1 Tax=Colocasia esculenta TaxID=4460 RepID=A0A843U801_COLES|nr:hypothetical protein [Colocasia esculenta]